MKKKMYLNFSILERNYFETLYSYFKVPKVKVKDEWEAVPFLNDAGDKCFNIVVKSVIAQSVMDRLVREMGSKRAQEMVVEVLDFWVWTRAGMVGAYCEKYANYH